MHACMHAGGRAESTPVHVCAFTVTDAFEGLCVVPIGKLIVFASAWVALFTKTP